MLHIQRIQTRTIAYISIVPHFDECKKLDCRLKSLIVDCTMEMDLQLLSCYVADVVLSNDKRGMTKRSWIHRVFFYILHRKRV